MKRSIILAVISTFAFPALAQDGGDATVPSSYSRGAPVQTYTPSVKALPAPKASTDWNRDGTWINGGGTVLSAAELKAQEQANKRYHTALRKRLIENGGAEADFLPHWVASHPSTHWGAFGDGPTFGSRD